MSELNTRVALLENMLVQQNESVNQRLSSIERVLSEVHNKLDTQILNQAVINTQLTAKHDAQDVSIIAVQEEIKKTNSKINGILGTLGTVILAITGYAIELFKK